MSLLNKELIVERLKEKTKQPIIRFELLDEEADIFDSKIGGAFYVPEDEDIPTNQLTDNELYLLVQLNFQQLPHIPSFPTTGLLQIFIAGDDDLYGANFDEPLDQEGFCIRYIKDIPNYFSDSCIHEPKYNEEICMPFDEGTEYKLFGKISEQAISIYDYHFNDILLKYCKDLLPDDCENYYDLDDTMIDYLYEELRTPLCQVGGYPCFTQWDPREKDYPDYDILLFQLDSVNDIMWGDSGVANFFIKKEDLENEDFSSVLYNWDCC